jgi:hypothetical protein
LHDENAGAEPERAGPVPGLGLAHNLPGIGPPPSVMMGASNSGGYEPLEVILFLFPSLCTLYADYVTTCLSFL